MKRILLISPVVRSTESIIVPSKNNKTLFERGRGNLAPTKRLLLKEACLLNCRFHYKLRSLFRIPEETSKHKPFGFVFLLFLFITLQSGCYLTHYEIKNKNPILQLQDKYSIHVDSKWTTIEADTLLKILQSIYPNPNLHFSTWTLSNHDLENGIKIESKDKLKFVTISKNIFPTEESQEVVSPGKDLYYAVVLFITENGTNRSIIELILQKRYGIYVPTQTTTLTEMVANETTENNNSTENKKPKRYSNFENDDLMLIISTLEEFPQVLHKIPQLKYIIRRIDKDDNKDKKGISYARTSRGHIEFAESTFLHGNTNRARHVIAHEKAHFLWAYVFNNELRADWTKLGGWYQDSTSESGWLTTKERSNFVSNYAYTENPNEDMAESIGWYFLFPDRLRSCCPEKYDFIHNRIMLLYGKRWGTSSAM